MHVPDADAHRRRAGAVPDGTNSFDEVQHLHAGRIVPDVSRTVREADVRLRDALQLPQGPFDVCQTMGAVHTADAQLDIG